MSLSICESLAPGTLSVSYKGPDVLLNVSYQTFVATDKGASCLMLMAENKLTSDEVAKRQ